MSKEDATTLLARFKQREQADVMMELTPEQLEVFEHFAGTVLNELDQVNQECGFGMVTRHSLNLRFNHIIRKDVYPGGFAAAMIRMSCEGYLQVRKVLNKLIVANMETVEKMDMLMGNGDIDAGNTQWSNAWRAVLDATGHPADPKLERALKVKNTVSQAPTGTHSTAGSGDVYMELMAESERLRAADKAELETV